MVSRYLRPFSISPLPSSKSIVQKRCNLARPFSDVKIIPIIGHKHSSDVPSKDVLSRLSIFSRWCDVPNIQAEQKQGSDSRSQEAEQQEKKEAQKKNDRNATGDLCLGDSGVGGEGGCTRDPSEQNSHGREQADTWAGSEGSGHESSSGSTGGCFGGDGADGGGWADGGGCDGGF